MKLQKTQTFIVFIYACAGEKTQNMSDMYAVRICKVKDKLVLRFLQGSLWFNILINDFKELNNM